MSPDYYTECTCPTGAQPGPHHPQCATETAKQPTPPEPNNLGDALTELRALRADLARADKPTRDLLAELADTRRTLTSVKQQRDRLDGIYQRMVSDAADVERALLRAGFEQPTFRSAELIDRLAADRDQAVERLRQLLDQARSNAEVTA